MRTMLTSAVGAVALLASFAAGPALAATLGQVSGPGAGAPVTFTDWTAGYDRTTAQSWGRDFEGRSFHDSAEAPVMEWRYTGPAVTSLVLGIMDANDQPDSFFRLFATMGGQTFSYSAGPDEDANANLAWLEIASDEPVTDILFRAETSAHEPWGDGYAVVGGGLAAPAPVPLPAAGALLALGLAGLGAAYRRKH